MKKLFQLCLVLFFVITQMGCFGERVSIPPGEIGRIVGPNGMSKQNMSPGAFRLSPCHMSACEKLIVVQTQKATMMMAIDKVFLPKSNIDITNVQIGIQFQLKKDDASLEKIFSEVRVNEQNRITIEAIYKTYLERKAADAVITALREYEVDQILSSVPEISDYSLKKINEMLADTPVQVTEIGFPDGIGQLPQEVIDAKRKLYAVEEQKARDIKALQAELIIEEQRQAVQRRRTANDVENARVAGLTVKEYIYMKNMERSIDEKVPFYNILPFHTAGDVQDLAK